MRTFDIRLSTINDVRKFVALTSTSVIDIDLAAGRYLVDGKSIMGIFSLDLTKSVAVQIHDDGREKEADRLEEALSVFRV